MNNFINNIYIKKIANENFYYFDFYIKNPKINIFILYIRTIINRYSIIIYFRN
jgi:hypothetical protein